MGTLLDPTQVVTRELLEEQLPTYLRKDRVAVRGVEIAPLNLGTSGARLFSVVVPAGRGSLRLILKISRPGRLSETRFYQELASSIPIGTPRVVSAGVEGDAGWVLMEEVRSRDHLAWELDDYRLVVQDMARLHSAHWGKTDAVARDWMTPTSREALPVMAADLIQALDALAGSWLPAAAPDVFSRPRLDRMRSALEDVLTIAEPLYDAGLTLVHGDYWFYNVLLTEDGRRLMVDWQDPMVWSGLWELAYFINLLMPMGDQGYRELPVPEETVVGWYETALRARGISLPDRIFSRGLNAARIIQPLIHWLPQMAGLAAHPEWREHPLFEPTRAFQRYTFDRWDVALAQV